jgi:hypothetical protein
MLRLWRVVHLLLLIAPRYDLPPAARNSAKTQSAYVEEAKALRFMMQAALAVTSLHRLVPVLIVIKYKVV